MVDTPENATAFTEEVYGIEIQGKRWLDYEGHIRVVIESPYQACNRFSSWDEVYGWIYKIHESESKALSDMYLVVRPSYPTSELVSVRVSAPASDGTRLIGNRGHWRKIRACDVFQENPAAVIEEIEGEVAIPYEKDISDLLEDLLEEFDFYQAALGNFLGKRITEVKAKLRAGIGMTEIIEAHRVLSTQAKLAGGQDD